MRELNEKEAMMLLQAFMDNTVSGTLCINRVVSGKYFAWIEKVVKLKELDSTAADAFRDLIAATGAQRLEAICNEKTGEPDRLKLVITP